MSGLGPPIRKSSIRSWNWPWMSPQTVTGHFYIVLGGAGAGAGWITYHWLHIRLFLKYLTRLVMLVKSFCIFASNSLYRKVLIHLLRTAACSSSNSRSSRPKWGSSQDLVSRTICEAQQAC